MLVTLGTNQTISANSSQTFTYSPNSVQEVHLALQDADWEASRITVQIGSRTIVNAVRSFAVMGMTQLVSGTQQSASNGYLKIDLGSWECTRMDNLYVTIQAVNELAGIDISALVNEPRPVQQLKWTTYADNTFTSPNNLYAISYDDGAFAAVSDDNYNIEIRNRMQSSAPSLISANTYYQSLAVGSDFSLYFGFLNSNAVPMATTYNYSSSAVTDTIVCCEAVGSTPQAREQAKESKLLTLASVGK